MILSGTARRFLPDFTIMLPFLMLLIVNTWHHAPWGDELHAWGLVLASPGITDVYHNLHYEGHPGLWHSLLWSASFVSDSPATPRVVHLLIGSALLVMVAFRSPFSRIETILLLLNYFLVFEYTVLARNYGIAMLLALLYARLRARRPDDPILPPLVLGIMANSNVYAFFLAGLLGLEYYGTGLIATRRLLSRGPIRLLLGIGLFAALMLFCVATVWPPADISRHAQQAALPSQGIVARFVVPLLQTVIGPLFPVDFGFPASFAFPGHLYDGGRRLWLSLALLPPIGIALWTIFRTRLRFLALLTGLILVAALFAAVVYPAAIRHTGIIFAAFVTLLWLQRTEAPAPGRSRAATLATLALLALGAAGGLAALAGQWMRPFSIDPAIAAWLERHAPPGAVLVGSSDIRIEPVAILLRRRFYALDCRCEDSYVRFSDRRDGFTPAMIPERLEEAVRLYRPRPVVLLDGDLLDESIRAAIRDRGMTLTPLVHRSGAERDRDMTVFEVTLR
jgi:hypothetical protein